MFLKNFADRDLKLYDALLCELRERGVIRSSNHPVADHTERLAEKAFGLRLGKKSMAGHDGTCPAGLRYEVKGRRRTPQNRSLQLSQIRGLTDAHFDYLIGVIFRSDFSVDYAARIPHHVVVEKAVYRQHTNAWILHLRPDLLRDARVVDVTPEITAAADALSA